MFHDGQVNGVAGGQAPIPQDNLFRALDHGPIHRQHSIDDANQRVERWLDRAAAVDCDIAVQDLLEHPGIRNQALAVTDQLLK